MEKLTANGAGLAVGIAIGLILGAGIGNVGAGLILGVDFGGVSLAIASRTPRARETR